MISSLEEFAAMVERMVPLFVEKARTHPTDPFLEDWEGVIATVIADTYLCLTVDGFLDKWEQEDREARLPKPWVPK